MINLTVESTRTFSSLEAGTEVLSAQALGQCSDRVCYEQLRHGICTATSVKTDLASVIAKCQGCLCIHVGLAELLGRNWAEYCCMAAASAVSAVVVSVVYS